jgi:H+-transporting ATPase
LKRADVGIAVAGATDAARAAADIILTEEGLSTIIHGIEVAREIFQRISNFITYRIAATLQLLCFFFIATFAFHPNEYELPPNPEEGEEWPEFFQMPVLLLMIITVLNDGTLITIAYDNAIASVTPNKWNLPALFMASSVLGFVSCFSSLIFLWFMLDSWNPDGFFQSLNLSGVHYGQIISAMYLKVSVSDFLTLFSARTGPKWFWQIKPALTLFIGGCLALSASSLIAIFVDTKLDDISVSGLKSDMGLFAFVWIYSLIFWFIQDAMKVGCYAWMLKANFNGISNTGVMVLPESAQKLIKEYDAAVDDLTAHH